MHAFAARSLPVGRRRLLHGAVASAAAWALGAPALAQPSDAARTAMAGAATAFLATLGAEARRRAVFAFDDRERLNWHYELMKASLSAAGYAKAVNVTSR